MTEEVNDHLSDFPLKYPSATKEVKERWRYDLEESADACSLDSYYEILDLDGFRLPPARGAVDQYLHDAVDLLQSLI